MTTSIALAVAIACVLLFLSSSIHLLRSYVHGHWDAWMMWNLKARFIVRAAEEWSRLFEVELSHVDYPLLQPFAVARLWLYTGHESPLAPRMLSLTYGIATLGLATGVVAWLRHWRWALLTVALLCTSQLWTYWSSMQYADTPLTLFMFLSLGAGVIAMERPEQCGWSIVSGLALGAAAFTKNEGIAFAAVVIPLFALLKVWGEGWRSGGRSTALFLVGLAVVAWAAAVTKLLYAGQASVLQPRPWSELVSLITDAHRHAMIRWFVQASLPRLGSWLALGALLLGAVISPGDRSEAWRRAVALVFGAAMIQGAIYYVVFLTTSEDLDWHLRTACARLMTHLWPALLLAVVLLAPRSASTTR